MVDSQRTFVHITCEIMNTCLLDFVFFLISYTVSTGESESRSNGRAPRSQTVRKFREIGQLEKFFTRKRSKNFSNCPVSRSCKGVSSTSHMELWTRDFWTSYPSLSLCIVPMCESESRSNSGLSKNFHPHWMWNYEHVSFGLCVFFLISCPVPTCESESRSNGRVVKGVHPHRMWNYEDVIFGLCVFFEFMHCTKKWKWVPVKWWSCKGVSSTSYVELWTRDFWTLHFFLSLCIVPMGENEFRSNGGLSKDFHPHHIWNHEHVTFGLCVFFNFMHCVNGWKWVPVKW